MGAAKIHKNETLFSIKVPWTPVEPEEEQKGSAPIWAPRVLVRPRALHAGAAVCSNI